MSCFVRGQHRGKLPRGSPCLSPCLVHHGCSEEGHSMSAGYPGGAAVSEVSRGSGVEQEGSLTSECTLTVSALCCRGLSITLPVSCIARSLLGGHFVSAIPGYPLTTLVVPGLGFAALPALHRTLLVCSEPLGCELRPSPWQCWECSMGGAACA